MPGGQILGATFDYTQRLLDFELAAQSSGRLHGVPERDAGAESARTAVSEPDDAAPPVLGLLEHEGLVQAERARDGDPEPGDLTRDPFAHPASRALRLQNLARGDEGFLLAMGYSTQRGYANNHPFAGEIRSGTVAVEFTPPELGFAIVIGEIELTECQMINQFAGSATEAPCFTRGYGLAFGHAERKAMAMALVDRSLRAGELGEHVAAPAQDEEFVLAHSDNLEASGFVQHLKLPHYVDFQAELELVRLLRADREAER